MADQSSDRRQHPRYRARWRIALFDAADSSVHFLGRTLNVGQYGATVELPVNPAPKASYRMFMEIPRQNASAECEIVEALCRVRFSVLNKGGFQANIEFTHFERDSAQLLGRVLASGRFSQIRG